MATETKAPAGESGELRTVMVRCLQEQVEVEAEVFGLWAVTPELVRDPETGKLENGDHWKVTHLPTGRSATAWEGSDRRSAMVELARLMAEELSGPEWHAVPDNGETSEAMKAAWAAVYYPWREAHLKAEKERKEAEKRIRAAAIDLLEALEATMVNGHYGECIAGVKGQEPSRGCSQVCRKVRAAIAKARGL